MLTHTHELSTKLIDEVEKLIANGHHPYNKEQLKRFSESFFSYMPPEDLVTFSVEQLYGCLLSLWDLLQKRTKDKANIRIINPTHANHGWDAKYTIIEIVNDDMPFLVDSVRAELTKFNVAVHLMVHPVIAVKRDQDKNLRDIAPCDTEGYTNESIMQIYIGKETDPEILSQLKLAIKSVLKDVNNAVHDWKPMREKLLEIYESLPVQIAKSSPLAKNIDETQAFLKWIAEDHFTFLGYRRYDFAHEKSSKNKALIVNENSGLGILKDDDFAVFNGLRNYNALPPDVRYFLEDDALIMITKTNCRATIHRPVLMDGIFIKIFDKKGNVVGEHLFIGLFTSAAYNKSASDIPFLRQKLNNTLRRANYKPYSHNGKALLHIIESLPRDELFQISEDDLFKISIGVLNIQDRLRTTLFLRKDPFERFINCFLYVPKEKYDTHFRIVAEHILAEAFEGECQNYHVKLAEGSLAQVHFVIKTTPGKIPDYDPELIERQLVEASKSWEEHLQTHLTTQYGEQKATQLLKRYADAFPPSYQAQFDPQSAVLDIEAIEKNLLSNNISVHLYHPIDSDYSTLSFKVYQKNHVIALSDILPVIEHMGLTVLSEQPFNISLSPEGRNIWIHDFKARTCDGKAIDLSKFRNVFETNFIKVWHKELENDALNGLTLHGGLDWETIMLLRAYCKFLKQTRFHLSYEYVTETLAHYSEITLALLKLFEILHSPQTDEDKLNQKAKEQTNIINHMLEEVDNLDQDKILRRILNLIESTLRTNFYQHHNRGGDIPYIALKFDSKKIDKLPLPRPWKEIFVYNSRVEATHLRGGKVARGGIRWSDRYEDFRTEILGLMKAQNVKNTLIVPIGSKGGFIVKQLPGNDAGRDAIMAEVIHCYKTMMNGLLDITDNLKQDKIIPPANIRRHDEDDPYLVVAADKGTATFSDIANQISIEHDFWLGDAFASGGSAGYDHKKMGITAKGAWESVKRHFREMGHNIQNEDFTCVGVGDMSGDVFGNGMLLSKHTKLIGAFNHLHIFCDPNPDIEKSYKERERLFKLPRSSWVDYNPKLLSKGGAIFDRSAKSLKLTPEIKKAFGIKKDQVTPHELIRAMLTAEIDLLWFGGIGTYIKSAKETNEQVGDKHNDLLRVNGEELKAKVLGEGANLAITQLGRIEYALKGGRLNTDAIDNAAGVNTSDREVNIKILLGDVVTNGDMTLKQRDKLLEQMTDEVAFQVLKDNYDQTGAITLIHYMGEDLLETQINFMLGMEKSNDLNRKVECLPDDDEIDRRLADKIIFTRPELAVLFGHAKIKLSRDLLETSLPDDPYLETALIHYFPTPLREKYKDNILKHRLRREIVATYLTNLAINYLGPSYIWTMHERTNAPIDQIVKSFIIAYEAFDIRNITKGINELDNKVDAKIQTKMFVRIQKLLKHSVEWHLHHTNTEINLEEHIKSLSKIVEALRPIFLKLVPQALLDRYKKQQTELSHYNVPEISNKNISELLILESSFDLSKIMKQVDCSIEQMAHIYFTVGRKMGLAWARSSIIMLQAKNSWQQQAILSLYNDIEKTHIKLVTIITRGACATEKAEDIVQKWLDSRIQSYKRLLSLIEEVKKSPKPDFSMLMVVCHHLASMLDCE